MRLPASRRQPVVVAVAVAVAVAVGVAVGVAVAVGVVVAVAVVVGVVVVVVVVVAVCVMTCACQRAAARKGSDVSPVQHMEALAKANEVRLARAEVRHALFERRMTVAQALGLPCCQTMLVRDLLCAQYRWGRVKMLACLRDLPVPVGEMRHIAALTDRQREALVAACSPREKGGTR